LGVDPGTGAAAAVAAYVTVAETLPLPESVTVPVAFGRNFSRGDLLRQFRGKQTVLAQGAREAKKIRRCGISATGGVPSVSEKDAIVSTRTNPQNIIFETPVADRKIGHNLVKLKTACVLHSGWNENVFAHVIEIGLAGDFFDDHTE